MPHAPTFRSTLASLWLRLSTLGIVSLVFTELLNLSQGKAQGWSFYLRPSEVAFEIFVRVIAAALLGMALGTICSAIMAPICWFLAGQRERLVNGTVRVGVVLVVFLVSRFALEVMIKWSYTWSSHPAIYDKLLLGLQFVAFAVALALPRPRKVLLTSLDGFLTPTMTRRTALATVAGTAALVTTEFVLSKSRTLALLPLPQTRPKSNILLISFDALAAEDMSLYGYKLPTTPNIDAFAKKSTVFTHYYAASTFTTPCIGVMLTGRYPSDNRVYGLSGRVPTDQAQFNLAKVLREGGYFTAAFLTNPWAYYLAQSLRPGFNWLPDPQFDPGGMQRLWDATAPLHQNSGIGSRIDEYFDLEIAWNKVTGRSNSAAFRYRPGATMRRAKEMMGLVPEGFFLWIHGMPPHHPYLPGSKERDRYLPQTEVLSFQEDPWSLWKPHYAPDQQKAVDRRRLAYDEFMATTDRRFGELMEELDRSGKLKDTTVILTADHGESFEGGIYQHQTPYLTRPVIHIPLVVHAPGQTEGRTIDAPVDQTSLAPTILELAGQSKPEWMRGQSVAPWITGNAQPPASGMAFCQYLERNSIFKPLRKGTLGVIDGEYQYVVYLDNQNGDLRPLPQAQYWNINQGDQNPGKAASLRAAIQAQFPDLVT